MTGYKKRKVNVKGKSEWFVYKRFGKEEGLRVAERHNCDCRAGVRPALLYQPFCFLGDGDEAKGMMLQRNNAKKLYYFRYAAEDGQTENEALFFLGDNGMLYQQRPNQLDVDIKARSGEDGAAVVLFNKEGRHGVLFVGKGMAWHDFEGGTPMDLHCVVAVCAYKGRAFIGLEGGRILFSEPDEPCVFKGEEGNSYIDLTAEYGEITNFVVWKEKIYVILEYGIYCLIPSGDMAECRLERLPYSGGKIFCTSAAVCGEKIYFLAEDGVYAFDGKTAEKVCKEVPVYPLKEGQLCTCTTKEDRFLLCYQDEKRGNTTLVIFDGNTPTACFADGFKSLGGDGSRTLFTILEDNLDWLKKLTAHGEVYGQSFFKSSRLTFGKQGRKTLKRLLFHGRGEFLCRVHNGNHIVERWVDMGSDKETGVGIDLFERGEGFCLEFVFTKEAEISSVAAEVAFGK
ncbi:MAG: hypothetical protein E7380_05605 [Clostridiales bacterium]|nr:hypothetical protein [Clostridiales bacterium]